MKTAFAAIAVAAVALAMPGTRPGMTKKIATDLAHFARYCGAILRVTRSMTNLPCFSWSSGT